MLFLAPGQELTVDRCHEAYIRYCSNRGWVTLSRNKFAELIGDTVARTFALTISHDIQKSVFGSKRGWRGIAVSCTEEEEL